jgi:hypothetical protein
MNPAYRALRKKERVACRVSEMLELLQTAAIFDPLRYAPEAGSPGFVALSEFRQKTGGKALPPDYADTVIKKAQAEFRIPGDEWRKPLGDARAKIEKWLFGNDPKIWPIVVPLVTEVARSRRAYGAIDVSASYPPIGKALADLAFSEIRAFSKLSAVVERWHGASTKRPDTTAKKEKNQELETLRIAFGLWRELKRNPTRKELFAKLPTPDSHANRLNSDADKQRRDALRNAALLFIK